MQDARLQRFRMMLCRHYYRDVSIKRVKDKSGVYTVSYRDPVTLEYEVHELSIGHIDSVRFL